MYLGRDTWALLACRAEALRELRFDQIGIVDPPRFFDFCISEQLTSTRPWERCRDALPQVRSLPICMAPPSAKRSHARLLTRLRCSKRDFAYTAAVVAAWPHVRPRPSSPCTPPTADSLIRSARGTSATVTRSARAATTTRIPYFPAVFSRPAAQLPVYQSSRTSARDGSRTATSWRVRSPVVGPEQASCGSPLPSAAHPSRRVVHAGVGDSLECTPCRCGAPAGASSDDARSAFVAGAMEACHAPRAAGQ
jgi:hypothetical protein